MGCRVRALDRLVLPIMCREVAISLGRLHEYADGYPSTCCGLLGRSRRGRRTGGRRTEGPVGAAICSTDVETSQTDDLQSARVPGAADGADRRSPPNASSCVYQDRGRPSIPPRSMFGPSQSTTTAVHAPSMTATKCRNTITALLMHGRARRRVRNSIGTPARRLGADRHRTRHSHGRIPLGMIACCALKQTAHQTT